jgi:NADH:ubiquinone oxidoreductase subunit 5 (subunit L)/multisubunit Na+/H+ antiporter MnhA subunit
METNELLLLMALALPLLIWPWLWLAGRRLKHYRVGWLSLVFPVVSFSCLLGLAARLDPGTPMIIEWPWIPSLGINFSFLVDGFSLFFGLIVSGVGCLIVFYAIYYMGEEYEHQGRFFCYLIFFMAAMLGTVFSNNLMLLFVFWELTGLASWLLIGFLHDDEISRVGARQALLVTAGTGLLMLVGIVMVFVVTGTLDLSAVLSGGLPFEEHKQWLTAAMLLILAGAFGKSAQFPFHFWLPNAMAAPTPVSAYLHSATMVKLGVFLCGRLFPVFVGTDWWMPVVGWIGFSTFLLGCMLALLSHELKAILAYSTVAQLGFLVGYYGLGPVGGVQYDYLHILNHVFYKGCLFMAAGVVMHATGLRDIRRLGGLFRRLPLLGVTTLIAAASMAGLPGTTGFISKEAMFKEIFATMTTHGVLGAYAAATVVAGSLIKVAFSVRLFSGIFLGREPEGLGAHFHRPPLGMQLPPLLLAGAALVFGLFPGMLEGPFSRLAVAGLNLGPEHLALWHGINRELLASAVVVGLGFGLYFTSHAVAWRWHRIPEWLRFDLYFEQGLEFFSKFTKGLTRLLRADDPVDYLPMLFVFGVGSVGGIYAWRILTEAGAAGAGLVLGGWVAVDLLRAFVAALIALAILGVLVLKRWRAQLISLSVAGFLICYYYVLYRAPDLALTQILIESVTLILILLLLGRFPAAAELREEKLQHTRNRKLLNVVISVGVGSLITGLMLAVGNNPHGQRIGEFFTENTVPLAEGSNAVNTILVDFRGFDTLGEITVLLVAMLGCLGLLMRYKRTPEEYREGPMGPAGFGTGGEGRR